MKVRNDPSNKSIKLKRREKTSPWIYFVVRNGSSVIRTGNGQMSNVKIHVIFCFFNVSMSVAAVKLPMTT